MPTILPLFPLNAVLFPDAWLPLQLFEQRYLGMAKECIRDAMPFGVCLIRSGGEVGTPAEPFGVGCSARIVDWDMQRFGILDVVAEGGERFRIRHARAEKSGLLVAEVEWLADTSPAAEPRELDTAQRLLHAVLETVGMESFAGEPRFDHLGWVADRLASLLPLSLADKQALLETLDPAERMAATLRRAQSLTASR